METGKPRFFSPVVVINMKCHDELVYFSEEYRSENDFGLAI